MENILEGFIVLEKINELIYKAMSYDIKIGPFETNHTYNGSREIKELVGFTPSEFDGFPACIVYKLVDDMLKEVIKNKEKLEKIMLSKYYGCGTYETWVSFLTNIKNACKEYQFEMVIVS